MGLLTRVINLFRNRQSDASFDMAAELRTTADVVAAELRKTERRLEALLDQLPNVILYETGVGREYISRNIEKLLGVSSAELTEVRGRFPALIHPADNAMIDERLGDWNNAGRPGIISVQFRVRTRSGEYIWLEDQIRGIEYEDGSLGMIGVMVDITARHAAQERYQAIVEAADVSGLGLGIFVNSSGVPVVVYVNEASHAIGGRTSEDVIGRPATEFLPGNSWHQLDHAWQKFLRGESVRESFEIEILHKDGHLVPISIGVTTTVLNDEPAIIAFLTDLTERKRFERELLAAKTEAEEISQMKSNILSNFSHELRTPLHSILGFSSLLAEEVEEPDLREYAMSVHRSGQRLLSTLTSIIEISQLETTSTERVLYPFVMHELLEEEVLRFQKVIEEHGLALSLDLRSRDLIVLLERSRFHKAFEKIISNAIKFTQKGAIFVELTEEIAGDEGVKSAGNASRVQRSAVIRIRDTGIGMSQSFLAKAFEEFKQESVGVNRAYEGTGLGLPLARSYIRLMNGDISLSSKLGEGTVVTITLPVMGKLPEAGA